MSVWNYLSTQYYWDKKNLFDYILIYRDSPLHELLDIMLISKQSFPMDLSIINYLVWLEGKNSTKQEGCTEQQNDSWKTELVLCEGTT